MAVVGLLCPLFWTALLSGARGWALGIHALHSGAFVLIGLLMMGVAFAREKR